jgi:GTP-binding protein HflX
MWTHLEKFRGGIGMRGPGETQLETDRRLINHRIKVLKERMGDVQRARAVQRSGREGRFRTALVGYTNAGKSSILRGLSGASDVFVEDRLFATLDPLTREVDVGEGYKVLVTDTVGFIRKLPHHLVASFRATLEETKEADLLLHVVDASHPQWEEQREVVDEVLADIGVHDTPSLYVFNKMDAIPEEQQSAFRERQAALAPESVFVSALEDGGLEPLRRALATSVRRQRPILELRVPASDGRTLAELYRTGEVLDSREDGGEMVLRARVPIDVAQRLTRAGVVSAPG